MRVKMKNSRERMQRKHSTGSKHRGSQKAHKPLGGGHTQCCTLPREQTPERWDTGKQQQQPSGEGAYQPTPWTNQRGQTRKDMSGREQGESPVPLHHRTELGDELGHRLSNPQAEGVFNSSLFSLLRRSETTASVVSDRMKTHPTPPCWRLCIGISEEKQGSGDIIIMAPSSLSTLNSEWHHDTLFSGISQERITNSSLGQIRAHTTSAESAKCVYWARKY